MSGDSVENIQNVPPASAATRHDSGAQSPPTPTARAARGPDPASLSILDRAMPEIRSVCLWVASSSMLRMLGFALQKLAVDCNSDDTDCRPNAFAMGLLWLTPFERYPGLVYASPWMFFFLRDGLNVVPNLPVRVAETMLGRNSSLHFLLVSLPIHILCTASTLMAVKKYIDTDASRGGLDLIAYADSDFVSVFCLEIVVTALFAVSFLVLPELCKLNGISRWAVGFVLFPVLLVAVDGSGTGSVLAPHLLYSLSVIKTKEFGVGKLLPHIAGCTVGSLVGGIIMRFQFPDEPTR